MVDLIEVRVRSSFEKQRSASAVVDGIVDNSSRRIARLERVTCDQVLQLLTSDAFPLAHSSTFCTIVKIPL